MRSVLAALSLLLFSSVSFGQVAKVLKTTGVVLVDGKALSGKTIASGAVIDTTASGSSVDIAVAGSFSRIKGSKLTLRLAKKKGEKTVFEMVGGELYSYLKKDAKQQLEVKTATSVMGVRGTKFYVADKPDDAYLCVCEGTVRATVKGGKASADVAAGFDVHIGKGAKKVTPEKSAKQMLDSTKGVFADMGYPVK